MKFPVLIFVVLLCSSCSCKKKAAGETASTETVSNVRISSALPEQTWETVVRTEDIELFEIRKILIEGTMDEYSNKLNFIRELEVNERQELLARLIDDKSYNWAERDTSVEFRPTKQYVLKGQGGRVNLLTDEDNGLVSFINLEGQKVIQMAESLQKHLKKIRTK